MYNYVGFSQIRPQHILWTLFFRLIVLQCPQPEEHPNSFVIADSLSIGSHATYHCYHGYHASVDSLSITCQESGNWTSLVGECSGMSCIKC